MIMLESSGDAAGPTEPVGPVGPVAPVTPLVLTLSAHLPSVNVHVLELAVKDAPGLGDAGKEIAIALIIPQTHYWV
jgi:hypothetical protein